MSDAPAPGPAERWLAEAADERLVLTASRRLSRHLTDRYDRLMLAGGRTAWRSASVRDWPSWLVQCYRQDPGGGHRTLLSTAAVRVLWERLAARHVDQDTLSSRAVARQAQSAWQRLNDWRVGADDVRASARSRDQRVFRSMLDDYLAELDRLSAIDGAQLVDALLARLEAGQLALPGQVLLTGFDRPSPAVLAVADAMRRAGCTVSVTALPAAAASPAISSYRDEDAEFRAAGRWARAVLESRPEASVAIVVAGLEQDAERVRRLVREGLVPGWQFGSRQHRDAVDVSYGRALSEYPGIAAALLLLRWTAGSISSADIGGLLRSPVFDADGADERARLERRLRGLPARDWTMVEFREALYRETDDEGDGWFRMLARLEPVARGARGRNQPSAWADDIDGILVEVDWSPAAGGLGSEDFQLVNRWREGLNEFASLDAVVGSISLRQAVQHLATLAGETVYQPELECGRVQVLGPLEAAGMTFDELRVVRADADRWPAPGRPHPLLAQGLQEAHGMPDAVPEDTLDFAIRVLDRLAVSAPAVSFSWSKAEKDELRSPSPLLEAFEPTAVDGPADPGWFAGSLAGSARMESLSEDSGPAVKGREAVAGGAHTVELQRSEPLAAFAVGRLGVRGLDEFERGITALRRGIVLHTALQRLYAGCPDREAIAAWSAAGRRDRIHGAVNVAVAGLRRTADGVQRQLLELEAARAKRLLEAVVDNDIARENFRIEGVEERRPFEHNGVVLRLQADRIDRLPTGERIILDYKTGRAASLARASGEPRSVQLALYAAALDQPVAALALLYVNAQEVVHRAAGRCLAPEPKSAEDWEVTLTEWRALVFRLIEGLAGGDVRVNRHAPPYRDRQLDVLMRRAEL